MIKDPTHFTEMSEDENVPLLPSLEEEFDEDSDVASSKVTIARSEEGRSCHCTGSVKMVIFVAVGVALLVVVPGVVLGITLPLIKVARKSSSSDNSMSSTVPSIHSSTTTASNFTMQSSYSPSTTSVQTFHTITATSRSIINPTPSHVLLSSSSTSSLSSPAFRVSSSQLQATSSTTLLPTSATLVSSSIPVPSSSSIVHLQ